MITVNNKHSRIFGDYIHCTAYDFNNLPDSISYEIAGGEISSYMPTSIFNNSYVLYLSNSNANSYIKYASSAYTLTTSDGSYSYATFDGFLNSYNDMINSIIDEKNDDVCYICVGKAGHENIFKNDALTNTALGYVDLEIDINY